MIFTSWGCISYHHLLPKNLFTCGKIQGVFVHFKTIPDFCIWCQQHVSKTEHLYWFLWTCCFQNQVDQGVLMAHVALPSCQVLVFVLCLGWTQFGYGLIYLPWVSLIIRCPCSRVPFRIGFFFCIDLGQWRPLSSFSSYQANFANSSLNKLRHALSLEHV